MIEISQSWNIAGGMSRCAKWILFKKWFPKKNNYSRFILPGILFLFQYFWVWKSQEGKQFSDVYKMIGEKSSIIEQEISK